MERYVEDYQKRRLTERVDIMTAINILKSQGYDHDELIGEMTKVFYVDLDAYNEIVMAARGGRGRSFLRRVGDGAAALFDLRVRSLFSHAPHQRHRPERGADLAFADEVDEHVAWFDRRVDGGIGARQVGR